MKNYIVRLLPLALVCSTWTPMAHAGWVTTDLGALGGVAGFSANGTVAGNNGVSTPSGFRSTATIVNANGARTAISAGFSTTLYDMNEAGRAVGQVEVRRSVLGGDSGARHAFTYGDGQLLDLGTLGGDSSVAVAVNNAGVAVGSSTTSAGEMHAFIANDSGMRDLGTLGGSFSSAQAINDRGQIAGVSKDVNGAMHAFFSDGDTLRSLGLVADRSEYVRGNVVALTNNGLLVMGNGTLFDTSKPGTNIQTGATFTDANDAGQIVGNMTFAGEAGYRAVVYQDGVFTNLGVLAGGMYSSASDINERGQVVGFSHMGDGQYHSFLYTDGKMLDIASLITGFTSVMPGGLMLNDRGQVAGIGLVGDQYHAYLLTEDRGSEVPEPGTLAVFALGLALLARRRWHFKALDR